MLYPGSVVPPAMFFFFTDLWASIPLNSHGIGRENIQNLSFLLRLNIYLLSGRNGAEAKYII